MKNIFYTFLIVALPLLAFSNAAQPGFWNAGGTGTFSFLHPEDSSKFQKIQMVKEKVSIQLYHGYAVVKGQYWMFNTTNDLISLKTGYPKNSSYHSKDNNAYLTEINFDSLYGLKIIINNLEKHYITELISDKSNYPYHTTWYVWDTDFEAQDTTLITVYFIVNTNNTIIRRGYSKKNYNGFIYILESGANWKQPIIEGEIRLQTMDNLRVKNIHGISPDTFFHTNSKDNILIGRFLNLSPTGANNIILSYSKRNDKFNFQEILKRKLKLYEAIDLFSEKTIDIAKYDYTKFKNPFKVRSMNPGIGLVFLFIAFGKWMIPALIILTVVILILRIRKRNKKKNNSSSYILI